VASATQVYGEAFMKKLYGEILPCPMSRVVALEDGSIVEWAGLELQTRHTRGHANHHLCVIEPTTKTLFSGDSFGVCYPKVHAKHGLVITVSTSPTDFDGNAALDWIRHQDLSRVALTHFSYLEKNEIQAAADQLVDQIRFSMAMVDRIKRESLTVERVQEHIRDWMLQYYAQKRIHLDPEDLKLLKIDFDVNAQGLVFAASKA
jgi:hypothetical protein